MNIKSLVIENLTGSFYEGIYGLSHDLAAPRPRFSAIQIIYPHITFFPILINRW